MAFRVEAEADPLKFWGRANEARVNELERAVRKSFYTVTSASLALCDTGMVVGKKYQVPVYKAKVDETFAKNPLHGFLQNLRNAINHKYLLNPDWETIYSPGEKKSRFILNRKVLERYDEWRSLAREYLEKHSYEIDVESVIAEYRTNMQRFHSWFRGAMMNSFGRQISEYLSYEKILKGEGLKNYWRQILNYGVQHKLDPYQYLDRFLTPTELQTANALQPSKEQVDLMIKMADEFEVCDDEIRGMVYKLFGVDS